MRFRQLIALGALSFLTATQAISGTLDGGTLSNEQWMDLFHKKLAGLDGPLFADPFLPAPDCDPNRARKTHALLVGAGKMVEVEELWTQARDNDVALLASALASRGADEDNITTLTGPEASHAGLTQATRALLDRIDCGDSVVLHFSGMGLWPGRIAIGRGDGGPFAPGDKQRKLSDFALEANDILGQGVLMLLNVGAPGQGDVLTPAALSELVTLYRNRGADVTVSLDVDGAAAFALEKWQAAADVRQYPRLTLHGGNCERDTTQPLSWLFTPCLGDQATALEQHAGALTVFYGAGRDDPSIEWGFPLGAPETRQYGYFTYQFATAVAAADRTTAGALARAIKTQGTSNDLRLQSYTFIATDPDLDVIAEDRKAPSEQNRRGEIIIDTPGETRAAEALSEPEVEIAGRIVSRGSPINVSVNGAPAALEAGGGFRATVPLEAGVNDITVFATTDREEVLRRDFELFYEGDIRAALGNGTRYLVVIANQDYNDGSGLTDLRTPVGDGQAVAQLMRDRFGFQTAAKLQDGTEIDLFLENATYRDIQLLMGDLAYAVGETDTVVIFYAGHGEYSEVTGTGYWLPVDARLGRIATYLDAKMITDTLQLLPARNALVISDSCYSGMLTRGGPTVEEAATDDRFRALQRLSDQRSRVVISSGGNEPVADGGGGGHSVFARALLDTLENPDLTAFSARELHAQLFTLVTGRADQSPDIRPIRGAGHDGGDVVFVAVD